MEIGTLSVLLAAAALGGLAFGVLRAVQRRWRAAVFCWVMALSAGGLAWGLLASLAAVTRKARSQATERAPREAGDHGTGERDGTPTEK